MAVFEVRGLTPSTDSGYYRFGGVGEMSSNVQFIADVAFEMIASLSALRLVVYRGAIQKNLYYITIYITFFLNDSTA